MNKVYILLLNTNAWAHTIECLESIFRHDYPSWQVIVCDNQSTDGSWEYMKAWAEGKLNLLLPAASPLRQFSFPPVPKPIPYCIHNRQEAEDGGDSSDSDVPLIFIQNGGNLGFTGGTNVALRYALKRDDFDYTWLLNNDTVIQKDTLSEMVHKIRSKSEYEMCGSTIRYYHLPDKIQARAGNRYNPWIGRSRHLGFLEDADTTTNESEIEQQMDHVMGTSMLVSKDYIEQVGLMSDVLFLYFDELDWTLRSKKHDFRLAYASRSVLYHKEGATIGGGNRDRSAKSVKADYFEIRNRLVITRKYYPWALPTVLLGLSVTILNRIRRRQWNRIWMVFKIVVDAFRIKL